MRQLPRRRLSELVTLYRLEPNSRDLFVEGTTDKAVFDFLLQEARPFGCSVRWIDEIELDAFDVTGMLGAKGRVIALATFAEREDINNIVCVIDRNVDSVVALEGRTWLHPTVFPDLEFHLTKGQDIGALLARATGLVPPEVAMKLAVDCAKVLFAVRLVSRRNEEEDPSLVDVAKSIDGRGGERHLNIATYLSRVDSRNDSGVMYSNMRLEVEEYVRAEMPGDDFMHIEFHRYEECLEAALREWRYTPDGLFGRDWLGRLIRAAMQLSVVEDPFVVRVLARING